MKQDVRTNVIPPLKFGEKFILIIIQEEIWETCIIYNWQADKESVRC